MLSTHQPLIILTLRHLLATQVTTDDEEEDEEEEGEEESGSRRKGLAAQRSRRNVKSRMTYVGGQPVLKSDMYDLKDGEPSVFDKELGDGSPDGGALADDKKHKKGSDEEEEEEEEESDAEDEDDDEDSDSDDGRRRRRGRGGRRARKMEQDPTSPTYQVRQQRRRQHHRHEHCMAHILLAQRHYPALPSCTSRARVCWMQLCAGGHPRAVPLSLPLSLSPSHSHTRTRAGPHGAQRVRPGRRRAHREHPRAVPEAAPGQAAPLHHT